MGGKTPLNATHYYLDRGGFFSYSFNITRKSIMLIGNPRNVWLFRIIIEWPTLTVYRDGINISGVITTVFSFLCLSTVARAGEIEPRTYVNTPIGINFLLTGFTYSDGGLSTEASSPAQDAQVQIHTGVLAHARSLDVRGKSSDIRTARTV